MNSSNRLSLNPLLSAQREKSGASTFGKYGYQYHWALCKVLDIHDTSDDYIVFIELHEDVLIADSTNASDVRFEFNQVKDSSSGPYTYKALTKTSKKENSILGKMMLGIEGKPFKDKISSLNLVATCGFNLPLTIAGVKLDIIKHGDIDSNCIQEIEAALIAEVGLKNIPTNLAFVTPDLPNKGYQQNTVGKITELVDKLNPGSKCNALSIYRNLIDELCRKGMTIYDYTNWQDVIKHKGLTKNQVGESIAAYTDTVGIDKMRPDFDEICILLNVKFPNKSKIRQAFERYHNSIRFKRSLLTMGIQAAIKTKINENLSLFEKNFVEMIDKVQKTLPSDIKDKLGNEENIKAAVIYEVIIQTYEK